jgi:hypothetical protein
MSEHLDDSQGRQEARADDLAAHKVLGSSVAAGTVIGAAGAIALWQFVDTAREFSLPALVAQCLLSGAGFGLMTGAMWLAMRATFVQREKLTTHARPWYRFTRWQIVESVVWVAIGLAIIKANFAMSQEMKNSIWIFSFVLAGPAFGAAIGSLMGQRFLCAMFGLPVWLLGVVLWFLLFR